MTQEIYQRAIRFAGEKHHEQKVPGSKANYLLHISNVAMEILVAYNVEGNFDVDYAVQLALLHDTLEDTETELIDLENIFGKNVATGVQALTKNEELPTKKERMMDSLNRINSLQDEVGMVKLADRITNLQKPPKFWGKDKIVTYLNEAILIDEKLADKNKYLNNRLRSKIDEYEEKYAV